MEALLVVGAAVSAVGTLVGSEMEATATKASGQAQKSIADYHASQLQRKAGQERAVSQQQAILERRAAGLAQSRARAVAAASGAGAGDPTVRDILAALRGEGEYRAKSALYEGEEIAKGLESEAAATKATAAYNASAANYSAKASRTSGYLSAAGTLISGGASYYDKYWPKDEAAAPAPVDRWYGRSRKGNTAYG